MKVVCRCEDITYEDVIKAIREGYTDMESLKESLTLEWVLAGVESVSP